MFTHGRTHGCTHGRTPDRPVYYKLTLSAFGLGELKTRTVRGSDYSPAIELSEQKDKLITATGDTEKYSKKQANKVWLNSVYWFSRY